LLVSIYNLLQRKLTKSYQALQSSAFSIFGFLMANEVPDKATLTGGTIILSGILIFNFGGKIYEFFFAPKRGGHSVIDKKPSSE